jgi:hypothetical protein
MRYVMRTGSSSAQTSQFHTELLKGIGTRKLAVSVESRREAAYTFAKIQPKLHAEGTMPKKPKNNMEHDARFIASVDLIGRTGAEEFRIQYCDEEAPPVIWMASASWNGIWEVAASINPLTAVFRLLDEVIDGAICTHCERPSGFEPSTDPMPLSTHVCWYQWDPSTKKFARGCA